MPWKLLLMKQTQDKFAVAYGLRPEYQHILLAATLRIPLMW